MCFDGRCGLVQTQPVVRRPKVMCRQTVKTKSSSPKRLFAQALALAPVSHCFFLLLLFFFPFQSFFSLKLFEATLILVQKSRTVVFQLKSSLTRNIGWDPHKTFQDKSEGHRMIRSSAIWNILIFLERFFSGQIIAFILASMRRPNYSLEEEGITLHLSLSHRTIRLKAFEPSPYCNMM